jgi:hypothetical protein
MNIFDLVKAMLVCGTSVFVVYSYPIVLQVAGIGFLALLWLSYACKTFKNLWS